MTAPATPSSPSARMLGPTALVAMCTLSHAAMAGGRVGIALGALAMGASPLLVGLLLASHALFPTLFSVWMGRWVDRVGTRGPAFLGMGAMATGLMLPVAIDTPGLFFATAALVGSGYTLLLVALQNQLGRLPDEVERKAGFSRFASATAVSGALGPFVAGHAMAHGGVGWCFVLLSGLSITSLVAAWRWRHRLQGAADASVAASPRSLSLLRTVVAHPATRRVLLADLLIAIAWNANGFIVPLQAVQQGWPADVVGNLLGTFGFAVWLVRAVMPVWQRHLSDWQTIRVALAAGGACFALFPFASSLTAAFVLQTVLGLGLGISLPAVLALLHTHAPSERSAETLGLRVAVLNISYVVLPLVMGGLGAAIGVSIVFWSIGAGLSAGAVSLRSGGTAP